MNEPTTRDRVLTLLESGEHQSDVARVLGISRQRVNQLKKTLGITAGGTRRAGRNAEIRAAFHGGESRESLAQRFELSYAQINSIIRSKS